MNLTNKYFVYLDLFNTGITMKKKNGKEKVSTGPHLNQREYDEMLLNQDQSLPNPDQNLEQQLHMYFSQLVSNLRQNNPFPPINETINHYKQSETGRSEPNHELKGKLPQKRKIQYVNKSSQEPQISQLFHSLRQPQTDPTVFHEPSFELLHHDATPSNPISSPFLHGDFWQNQNNNSADFEENYSEEDDSDDDSEEEGNARDGTFFILLLYKITSIDLTFCELYFLIKV